MLRVETRSSYMTPGSVRNWWAGIEALTLLFIKEHNYLCGELRKARPPQSNARLLLLLCMLDFASHFVSVCSTC